MHDLIVDISLFRPGPVNSDMVTPTWRPGMGCGNRTIRMRSCAGR